MPHQVCASPFAQKPPAEERAAESEGAKRARLRYRSAEDDVIEHFFVQESRGRTTVVKNEGINRLIKNDTEECPRAVVPQEIEGAGTTPGPMHSESAVKVRVEKVST